jgi:hypothetical protein
MRRARGQLTGPLAIAALLVLAACDRQANAVPPEAPEIAPPAGVTPAPGPAAPGRAAPRPEAPGSAAPGSAAAPAPAGLAGRRAAAGPLREATCATAPLAVRVVAIRRESADSIRVELALTNLAPADAWRPGSPAAVAVQAAVEALDAASVLSTDGRRRMFALRGSTGQRVGSPVVVPAPGRSEAFWALFPAAEGEVTVHLPGFAPLAGLAVSPAPGRPEP